MQPSADDFECLKLLHEHHVDAPKLKKLLDLNVNQADAILIEYERTKKMPAQLVKAFLNGVFSGTVAHSNEFAQRASQIPPLQALLKNPGEGVGQTDPRFITDEYLGKGKGIQSRLTSIEKLKSKAEGNLKMLQDVLHERAPEMLESVADDIKKTGLKYTELFCKLDKGVMREVSNLISDLNEKRPVGDDAMALQPNSKHYPHLTNPRHPLFMIPLLKDAQEAKKRLDDFIKDIVKGINGADPKSAPLKSIERALAKVCEKYNGQFDMLTDLARGTIVCQNGDVLRAVLIKLKNAVSSGIARILRIKFRLDDQYDAMEAGGYRDILMNMTFPPNDHIVELQINLEEFVNIKNGGGHASYTVGRMLQAFDSDATTYTGILNSDKVRDIQTGLVKKATAFGIDGDGTEAKMVEALGSRSVQLIELHLMSVKFNGVLGNLKWLEVSAEHLGATLTDLCIKKCEVKGLIPPQVGLLLQLVKLNLSDNQLEGMSNGWTFDYEYFRINRFQFPPLFRRFVCLSSVYRSADSSRNFQPDQVTGP